VALEKFQKYRYNVSIYWFTDFFNVLQIGTCYCFERRPTQVSAIETRTL
jgi:hypothetical protein